MRIPACRADVGTATVDDLRVSWQGLEIKAVAEVDVAGVPTASPEEAATAVVIGTVLWEPVLLALRRLAQEAVSAESLGRPLHDAGSG